MKFRYFRRLLCVVLMLYAPSKAEDQLYFKDLTILVSSCDKYHELWNPFFELLFRHWPSLNTTNKSVPIVLISNQIRFDSDRVQNIQIRYEKSWSDNMLEALKQVKTKYVLILLEDYFITSFNERQLHDIFKKISQDSETSYIRFYTFSENEFSEEKYPGLPEVYYIDQYTTYRASTQASIWLKKDLMWILHPNESAWDFEMLGSIRAQGLRGNFLALSPGKGPFNYLNMLHGGHLHSHGLQELERMKIKFANHTKLPIE